MGKYFRSEDGSSTDAGLLRWESLPRRWEANRGQAESKASGRSCFHWSKVDVGRGGPVVLAIWMARANTMLARCG